MFLYGPQGTRKHWGGGSKLQFPPRLRALASSVNVKKNTNKFMLRKMSKLLVRISDSLRSLERNHLRKKTKNRNQTTAAKMFLSGLKFQVEVANTFHFCQSCEAHLSIQKEKRAIQMVHILASGQV